MGTKNISLPPELQQFVEAKVASGEYAHFSEVVRDGLRLLMKRDAEKLEWLREAVAEGVWSAEDEPLVFFDDAEMKRVRKRGRKIADTRYRRHLGVYATDIW